LAAMVEQFAPTERVSIVGHSYGGVVALRYAIDNPGRLNRLAVVEAPLPVDLDELVTVAGKKSVEELIAMIPRPQLTAILPRRRTAGRLAKQVLELMGKTTMVADLKGEPDIADPELARCAVEALLCYGSKSPYTVEARDRLGRLLPHSHVATIE